MFWLPLIIITLLYLLILREISKKTRQSKEEMQDLNSSDGRLRRSAVGNIERARSRTLKMTLVIGQTDIMYVLWRVSSYILEKKFPTDIPLEFLCFAGRRTMFLQFGIGLIALFTINFKREFMRCCCCLKSKWRNTRRKQRTASRLFAGRSTHTMSSMRIPSTANNTGMKFKMQTMPSDETICRYIEKPDYKTQANNGNYSPVIDPQLCRQNSNNFLVVHMKQEAL